MKVSILRDVCGGISCERFSDVISVGLTSYSHIPTKALKIELYNSDFYMSFDDVIEIIVDGVTIYAK